MRCLPASEESARTPPSVVEPKLGSTALATASFDATLA